MQNPRNNYMKKSEKKFFTFFGFVSTFIAIFFIIQIIYWGAILVLGVKAFEAISTTENIPQTVGKMVGEFEKARESNSK